MNLISISKLVLRRFILLSSYGNFCKLCLGSSALLAQLGYSPGLTDGLYGHKTRNAIVTFYEDQGFAFDGKMDRKEVNFYEKLWILEAI